MIKCTTKNGRTVYVTCTYDCEPNIGGFYCQIYLNEDCDHDVDNFTISADIVNAGLDVQYIRDYVNDIVIDGQKVVDKNRRCRNRKVNNLMLLNYLEDLITRYPDLRFGQILFNYQFIKWYTTKDGIQICDPFYEEPVETIKRVREQMSKNKNNTI